MSIEFCMKNEGPIPRAKNVYREPWQRDIEEILEATDIDWVVIIYERDDNDEHGSNCTKTY